MRKQKWLICTAIVLGLCLATGIFMLVQAKMEESELPVDPLQEAIVQQLEKEITDNDIISIMRSHGYYTDEIRKGINQYAEIIVKYDLSSEETAYFIDQLNMGRDLSKLCELYNFIKDTKLTYSDIGQLYAIGENNHFKGNYWAENAFDEYTKNTNTLDRTEILELLDENIELNDIQLANILSRKGVKNIREIVDDMKNGKSIYEIVSELYSEYSFSPELYQDVTDGYLYLECIDIAEVLDCDINTVIENGTVKSDCRNEIARLLDAMHSFIQENGLEDQVDSVVINEAKKELPEIETDVIEKKLNTGMTVREVIALFREE